MPNGHERSITIWLGPPSRNQFDAASPRARACDAADDSAITIGEIRLGIERLRSRDAVRGDRLERWLHGLHTAYADHIIGVDTETARGVRLHQRPKPGVIGGRAAGER